MIRLFVIETVVIRRPGLARVKRRPCFALALGILGILIFWHPAWAMGQSRSVPRQTFEVASVKPVKHFDPMHSNSMGVAIPGRVQYESLTVLDYIRIAYGVSTQQVGGGPNWIDTDRFSIEGTSRPSATVLDQMEMLRNLLADRFKLRLRQETRAIDGYVLSVSNHGLKISPADPNLYNPMTPGVGPRTMAQWAETLGRSLHAPVVDRTGLPGRYDFSHFLGRTFLMLPRNPDGTPATTLPDFVETKLGLTLKRGKMPMVYLVVTHLDQPTPN